MTNYFNVKLDDVLYSKGITISELSKMTGIKLGALSNLINNNCASFNKTHILKIMHVLKIKDLNEVLEIRDYYENYTPIDIVI